MKRREFIASASAAAAWPLAVGAQQPERRRRIGVLMGFDLNDLRSAYTAAFRTALQDLGWIDGHNVLIDTRLAPNIGDASAVAAELLALSPDVIFASPHYAADALHRQTRSIPIVAAISGDPVRAGFVQSYARPGGNITVFQLFEAAINAKYPQLLKDIAPHVTRAAVIHGENTSWREDFATIKTAAPSFKLQAVEIIVRDASDIERKIADFARTGNGGLIVPPDSSTVRHRQLILDLAAQNRLPALYTFREFVTDGGLMCYSSDYSDIYRRAASYVDRILKGEKVSDLPVQAPTKFELIINLKTAKTLGLEVPTTMLGRADEIIE